MSNTNTTCTECQTRCESHNITRCATCHTCPGRCDIGGCNRKASTVHAGTGRRICAKCAADPFWRGLLDRNASANQPAAR